jgi:F-type H+-transporting ATPase subunit delta
LKSASLQYANALADIVLQQGAAEPARKQLEDFQAAYAESVELRNFLASPAATREEKHAVIEKILARLGSSKIIRNFLFVIIDNQRTHLLPEIVQSFEHVLRQREGIAEAEVASAIELNSKQKSTMLQTLERLTGKKIEAKYILEPQLIGGAVVRIGDTIYDGSLRNRLNVLRAQLTAETAE